MRAEQAMMIGVGLLGAFAVYKMVTAKQAEQESPPTEPLLPGLPSTPNRPDGNGLTMLGDPLHMTQGQYYQARMLLVGGPAPFSNLADEEMIGKGLVAMGFEDVRVFMSLKDLPSNFPASQMMAPTDGTRWFQGMWKGPSLVLPRPINIQSMWLIPRPANAVNVSGYGRMTG